MVNTLSLRARLWNLQSRSIFLLLLAGVALQDVLLPSLSPIFLLTQIFVRTDPGDEPDGPRRLRSGLCETCDLDHSDRHSTCGEVFCVLTSPLPRTAQECRKGCDEDDDRAGHADGDVREGNVLLLDGNVALLHRLSLEKRANRRLERRQ